MANWQPASAAAVAAFHAMVDDLPSCEPRKMFGYACVFVQGYMAMGTHEVGVVMRLKEADRAEFITAHRAGIFEPMPGRPMREYVVVPPALYGKTALLRGWAERSAVYVGALPAKQKRTKAPKAKSPAAKQQTVGANKKTAVVTSPLTKRPVRRAVADKAAPPKKTRS